MIAILTGRRRLFASALTLSLFIISAAAGTPITDREVPNFHQVNEHLYRGGQPRPGSLKRFAELGIKTIVNLRGESDNTRAEEAEARAAGLNYISVPMNGFSRPTEEQIMRLMEIINTAENQPVFIHCKRGADRTGTVIASYRILHDGWTAKQAQAEADKLGMRWWEFGMKDYLRNLEKRQAKSFAAR